MSIVRDVTLDLENIHVMPERFDFPAHHALFQEDREVLWWHDGVLRRLGEWAPIAWRAGWQSYGRVQAAGAA